MGKDSASDWDWRDEARYEEDEFWKEIEVNNKRIQNKSKGGLMQKPINMATGGLMSKPPYLRPNDESDKEIRASDGNLKREPAGITPYDVNTPASARKGLPQRGLSPSRTRYSKGKEVKGWKYRKQQNRIVASAQHFKVNNKDYILQETANSNCKLLAINGTERVSYKSETTFNGHPLQIDHLGTLYEAV